MKSNLTASTTPTPNHLTTHEPETATSAQEKFLIERFSTPNPTVSARFHYFYHAPSSSQASDPPARSDLWCCVLFSRLG
ncbi:MAG: hypothetical protein ACSHYB_16420 [Roseibacillus sp.]